MAGTADDRSLIEYPSAFPIKVMGAHVEGFEEAVVAVALAHDPGFDRATQFLTLRGYGVATSGATIPDASLRWYSSVDGYLGTGRKLDARGRGCDDVCRLQSLRDRARRQCHGRVRYQQGVNAAFYFVGTLLLSLLLSGRMTLDQLGKIVGAIVKALP